MVFSSFLILGNTCVNRYNCSRAVASGGGGAGAGGGSCPHGSIEPEKSSLWMDLFSLVSVILIVVTCNYLLFSWPRNKGTFVSNEDLGR